MKSGRRPKVSRGVSTPLRSRLTDILLENDSLQTRCSEVTESLEETLKVAASVISQGGEEEGARTAIYREEARCFKIASLG